MVRLDDDNELLTRIAAIDPAVGSAPLSEGTMSRVIRHAMTPAPRTWSRGRFRLASLGALVGSGGLVLAGILGIQAATPGLSVFALGEIPQPSVAGMHGAPGLSTVMGSDTTYKFGQDQVVSSMPKVVTTYRLVSLASPARAALQVARVLGAKGAAVARGDGSFQVGQRGGGPSVLTWTTSGVVEWSYVAVSAVPYGVEQRAATVHAAALPTARLALRDAMGILMRLGTKNAPDVSHARVTVSSSEVDVVVPLMAGGIATDQVDVFAYGPRSTLEWARGVLATVVAGPAYPTITAARAVAVLQSDHGFVYYGGIAPMATEYAPLSPTPLNATSKGESSYGTSTAPIGPPPVVRVDIDEATLEYATYDLTNGTSWLLPTWVLSGPERGSSVAGGPYLADVIAISPRYVRLRAGGSTI